MIEWPNFIFRKAAPSTISIIHNPTFNIYKGMRFLILDSWYVSCVPLSFEDLELSRLLLGRVYQWSCSLWPVCLFAHMDFVSIPYVHTLIVYIQIICPTRFKVHFVLIIQLILFVVYPPDFYKSQVNLTLTAHAAVSTEEMRKMTLINSGEYLF